MASIIVVATSLSKIIIIIVLIDDKINNINKKISDIDIYIYINGSPPYSYFLFSYSNLFYNIDRIPLSIIPIVLPYFVSKLYDRAPTYNPKILRPLMVFAS